MAFESGSITTRVFYVPGGLPHDAVERFAEQAAPPIENLGREGISGWVTSRHLLDRDITPESATLAGYLYLYLMQAERKIPPALLRAECRMEELVEMRARGVGYRMIARRLGVSGRAVALFLGVKRGRDVAERGLPVVEFVRLVAKDADWETIARRDGCRVDAAKARWAGIVQMACDLANGRALGVADVLGAAEMEGA